MLEAIARLRSMTDSGTADYDLAGTTYWSDGQLQDHIDRYAMYYYDVKLNPVKRKYGGTAYYFDYEIPEKYRVGADFPIEGTVSGSLYWEIKDEDYNLVASGYEVTLNRVRFDEDQGGTSRYVSFVSYDLLSAAGDVWEMRAAHTSRKFHIETDNHNLRRQQYHEHCVAQAAYYRSKTHGRQTFAVVRRSDAV